MTDRPALLDIERLTRTFGHIRALDDVSVTIAAGSVHALVGENGAGKSTLGRIIAGVMPPDEGALRLRGTAVAFASPRDALAMGIALVAQELALVPQLTAAENVFLAVEPRRAAVIDRGTLRARYDALTERAGFSCPSAPGNRSRSCGRWPATRTCSCSTSPRPL
jgi:ABC-type sugar transport system ATPase subunit